MTATYTGTAFGIQFRSNQPLPEFQQQASGAAPQPLVTVHWQASRPQRLQAEPNHCCWDGSTFGLGIPAVGDFAVTTDRVEVHPAPGVALQDMRAYLVGSAMGALLHVRGVRVFHGSAVRLPDGTAALFCGHSTAGKSTLAATLVQQGHEALADDLAALHLDEQARPICQPGLARTKLWRDALQRLGLENQAGPHTQVMPSLDKHCLPVPTSQRPARLTRFYELQVDESSQAPLAFAPVRGMAKLSTLLTHVYRPHYLQTMGRQNQLLADVARLAQGLQVHRITRPRQGDTLPAIVAWLQEQWQHPPA